MSRITELEGQIKALSKKALDAVEDDRAWSEKADEVRKMDDDLKSLVEERDAVASIAGIADAKALTEAGDPADVQTDTRPVATKSIGEQFVEADGFKNVTPAGKFTTGAIPVDVKATFTVADGGAGLIVPQYSTNVVDILFKRLTVADLLASGQIGGNTFIYPKESSVTNAAAAIGEGDEKPASDLNVVQVTETLKKIATSLKVSDEIVKDAPATMSYVNGRLTLFVQLTEEDQLLNGSGSGNNVTGLLNRSGLTTAQAVGSDTVVDAIFKEITKIRSTAFIDPDGIVINPTDWQSIRLDKDANGQYYGGGPFTGPYGNGGIAADGLWGLPVVVTPSIAQGTALVGAFRSCAQVFRQGGITVEMTNSNEDDFLNNLLAVRAEERLLLAVYRPAGFGKVTGLT